MSSLQKWVVRYMSRRHISAIWDGETWVWLVDVRSHEFYARRAERKIVRALLGIEKLRTA
jgi:hypothetical protein